VEERNSKLDCLFVFVSIGPHHRAQINDCSRFLRCGLIQVADAEPNYPWTDEVPIASERATLSKRIPESREEIRQVLTHFGDLLQEWRPSVVFHGGCYDRPVMRALARETVNRGCASILISESTYADHPRNLWREMAKRFVLRGLYHGAICAGTRSLEYLNRLGFSDSTIWQGHGAVEDQHFARGASEARARKDYYRERLQLPSRYVLCVARHAPEKNIDTLLNAFAGVHRQDPTLSLVLCGSGPLTEQLRDQSGKLGILDNVHFKGWVTYSDLPYVYGLAAVTVLPSISEPWGLVVNESLSSGTPVIVSDACGCAPDLVRRGVSGYAFSPGDSGQLESLLRRLLSEGLGPEVIEQCQSVATAWSLRNRTRGFVDCVLSHRQT
jgi:glycosyltransferase involved in cell wall biosynthesis